MNAYTWWLDLVAPPLFNEGRKRKFLPPLAVLVLPLYFFLRLFSLLFLFTCGPRNYFYEIIQRELVDARHVHREQELDTRSLGRSTVHIFLQKLVCKKPPSIDTVRVPIETSRANI